MTIFYMSGLMLGLLAVLGYLNVKYTRLPLVLGMTIVSMILSLTISVISVWVPTITNSAQAITRSINWNEVIFHGFLGFLLFASSLHVKFSDMKKHGWIIFLMATLGVLISTVVIGCLFMAISEMLSPVFGFEIKPIWYFVFGALISPTDPIAVMALLKEVGAPKDIETKFGGESLFNDGTAVVVFMVLLAIAQAGEMSATEGLIMGAKLFAQEAVGGIVVGALIGFLGLLVIRDLDKIAKERETKYTVVQLGVTLALAVGGYVVCEMTHTSAPLGVVVMGLIIGNMGGTTMAEETKKQLFGFWDLLDEMLNFILFGMIGLYMIAFEHSWLELIIVLVSVPIVLLGRMISVAGPVTFLRAVSPTVYPHTIKILTWGGMRGAVSIALVLSLPDFQGKEILVNATYGVVLFSLLVQGLTMRRFLAKVIPTAESAAPRKKTGLIS